MSNEDEFSPSHKALPEDRPLKLCRCTYFQQDKGFLKFQWLDWHIPRVKFTWNAFGNHTYIFLRNCDVKLKASCDLGLCLLTCVLI